ncbi:MAG: ATP synthase F1 subunit gamma [Symbiobacteriaceae bacterium]|nr:ATP synthase F1 subunit gamma [Symbiobacteriaceae bacterium]
MASLKHFKRRMTTVATTQQVMKAMNMVAAAKLARVKGQLDAARPFYEGMEELLGNLKGSQAAAQSIYANPPQANRCAYIVISGDKGLCGSYNNNIAAAALEHIQAREGEGKSTRIVTVGLKAREFLVRRQKEIAQVWAYPNDANFFEEARSISARLVSIYGNRNIDEVYLAYTRFDSMLSYTPQVVRLLPLSLAAEHSNSYNWMSYDNETDRFLDRAVRYYLAAVIYRSLAEASVCEQAARMVQMDSAVSNAEEILLGLGRSYNRKRQAAITQEINEIVSSLTITSQSGIASR